jgi:hypothetical protein
MCGRTWAGRASPTSAQPLRCLRKSGGVDRAPSVALATLTLAFWKHGESYVSTEGLSMICGAVAFAFYSFLVCQLLMRLRWSALMATSAATVAWLVVAIGLKQVLLG